MNNGTVANNVWKRNDAWGRANLTGGTGTAACGLGSAGSGSGAFDTELWSPAIKMPATPRNLRFKSAYYQYTSQTGTLDVSTNGGGPGPTSSRPTTAVAEPTINMTAYANQTIVLRWKFVSPSWAYYWQVDDVRTETIPPPPPAPISQWEQNWDGYRTRAAGRLDDGDRLRNAHVAARHIADEPTIATGHTAANMFRFNSYSVSSGTARIMKSTADDLSSGTGYLRFWMYHDTAYTSA